MNTQKKSNFVYDKIGNMFTGLIEDIGTITSINNDTIAISCSFTKELNLGDSICVNGACLTATKVDNNTFWANLSQETFRVTNFKYKKIGDKVNLERALLATSRLDGHIVYGHIDTTTTVLDIKKYGDFCNIKFNLPKEFQNYIINKGSIAIDGISLTIASSSLSDFSVAVIPHSLELSTLQYLQTGQIVNIEFDVIAKYIEKKLSIYDNSSKISMEFLKENGFI